MVHILQLTLPTFFPSTLQFMQISSHQCYYGGTAHDEINFRFRKSLLRKCNAQISFKEDGI